MPRQTQDTLIGYGFTVQRQDVQVVDPKDGQPLFDGNGLPTMQKQTQLILVDQQTGHVTVVLFNEEGREELVRQLTGGIIVANGGPAG